MARWIDRNALSPKESLRLWIESQVEAFRGLTGQSVACWVGREMAVREEGPSGAPQFEDPTVPHLQVCPLYLSFVGGGGRQILTYQNDWPGSSGLCVDTLLGGLPDESWEPGSIFRTRALSELPTGLIQDVFVEQDSYGDIAEVCLKVAGDVITLWSGEVEEEPDGSLRIVRLEESVLIAVSRH